MIDLNLIVVIFIVFYFIQLNFLERGLFFYNYDMADINYT